MANIKEKIKLTKVQKVDLYIKKLNTAPILILPNPLGNRKKRRENKQRNK